MVETFRQRRAWHALPVKDVMRDLASTPLGLAREENARRLALHGPNRLPPPARRSGFLRFLAQFNNALVLVLLAASGVTLMLGHLMDTAVIVGVTVLNALIGFIQEGRAEAALAAIRNLLTPSAIVLREGVRHEVSATELVPGDVVLLG